jgi:group II intron reverse transcriptase/maturase
MVGHVENYSESWEKLAWKKLRKNLFRLQCRLYKAIRAKNRKRVLNLQKLILRSRSARLLAIRQVTQLNTGKKTAGVDGKKSLSPSERLALDEYLKNHVFQWKHQKLRAIPIPKKDGTKRILKVPTIADRSWQCLIKYAIEPVHEALFHPRSYGFRTGRCAHDCQRFIFSNLHSHVNGKDKRILEIDIEKCFDRINHNFLMSHVIAPQSVKNRLWKCLKIGVNPEFPEQGTPQGGVISPLLANIALDGIENIHKSVRYADDMVFFLKPNDNANEIRKQIEDFLQQRGLNIKAEKTKLVSATDGFDFLGWHFLVQKNGKFKSTPSKDNFKAFSSQVKSIVNNSNYGATVKAEKLAPIVRGWRYYHRYCKMSGSKLSLWFINNRTFKVFNQEPKMNRYQAENLIKKAFPAVPYSQNDFINVKGDYSPFNGDIVYWSKRQSQFYDGATSKALTLQSHKCGYCGLSFADGEKIHLHHVDGNHHNWKPKNLLAVHRYCHNFIHSCKGK